MNKIVPLLAVIGAAAAVATYLKKRNKDENATLVSLEDMNSGFEYPNLQPAKEAILGDLQSKLASISSEDVKLSHTVMFKNEDQFFETVKKLKEAGYTLDDVGDLLATVSKVIANNEADVEGELQGVYDLVISNHGLYQSYQVVEQ